MDSGTAILPPQQQQAKSKKHQQQRKKQQQTPSAFRNLVPQSSQTLQQSQQPQLTNHGLPGQSLGLNALHQGDADFQEQMRRLQEATNGPSFHSSGSFDRTHANGQPHHAPVESPHTPQRSGGGQFGILTPSQAPPRLNSIARLQQDDIFSSPEGDSEQKSNGHLSTKIVTDPPDLAEWREKLFDVNEIITLSQEEFETYFPHVDNVYSHRSTQRYKRKPFVSHYWDCRLKGRPPGTPKSEDPSKKKRKRTARERDLCDVKIKITEYFPGAMLRVDFVPDGPMASSDTAAGSNLFSSSIHTSSPAQQQQPPQQRFGVMTTPIPSNHPGYAGQRYYTIQRVNGNGGNGKGDGVAGPHKHTLDDSDKVKKNSVLRFMSKKEKEENKVQKTYHKRATGAALAIVKKHSKEHDLKLFGSCFCPFVQRVWIALEAKGMHYQYIEVDPYKKPQALLEVNPRGLVPGIRHGDWGCGESTVLMEYLEDLKLGQPLLPANDPQLRATSRLWSDHINRNITPAFYQLLQAQDLPKQAELTQKLQAEIGKLVDAAHPTGPFFLGAQLGFVDVQFAPWMVRFQRVLRPYRAWPEPQAGSRWARWLEAVEANEHVRATTSSDELYLDSYERYAQNRPGTSQLADAVNGGQGLP